MTFTPSLCRCRFAPVCVCAFPLSMVDSAVGHTICASCRVGSHEFVSATSTSTSEPTTEVEVADCLPGCDTDRHTIECPNSIYSTGPTVGSGATKLVV